MGPRVGAGHALPPGASANADWAANTPSLRRLKLPPAMLAYSVGNTLMPADVAVEFWINTPGVTCRGLVQLGVGFEQSNGTLPISSPMFGSSGFPAGATLWMCHADDLSGRGRSPSPTANIIGTGDTPVQVPSDNRLWGVRAELKTAGELIYGKLTIPAQTPDADCAWWLKVSWQGEDPMTEQEWREAIADAGIRPFSPKKVNS